MRLMTQLLTTCILLISSSLSVAMQVSVVVGTPGGGFEAPAGLVLAARQGGLSLDQAVQQVRRQYPGGKIVSAETRDGTHVIKVLTAEGTVRTVRISAR